MEKKDLNYRFPAPPFGYLGVRRAQIKLPQDVQVIHAVVYNAMAFWIETLKS
jgi:hypothetical protein